MKKSAFHTKPDYSRTKAKRFKPEGREDIGVLANTKGEARARLKKMGIDLTGMKLIEY